MDPTRQEQLPRERKNYALSQVLAPRAACRTKGNFLLRRTRSLALTIVAITQSASSRDSEGTGCGRWSPRSGSSRSTSASVLPSIAPQGEVLLPSAIQPNSPGVRHSFSPPAPRLGLFLENLEMADSIMGYSFI